MSKTKRQKRNKKFKFNVNRKRLNKTRSSTGTAAAGVPIVKKAWDDKKSIRNNLTDMGLAYDPNEALKIPKSKDVLKPLMGKVAKTDTPALCATKAHVAAELEAEAKAPREKKFELPSGQVQWLSYLIDKYGEDYEAMARDKRNIYQETWRKIRSKIRTFQKIPKQWNAYLASRVEQEQKEGQIEDVQEDDDQEEDQEPVSKTNL